MRVVELEPRAFKRLDVVNFHAVQIHRAHLVHGNLQAVELEHVIRLIGLILEGHVILESRASPPTTATRSAVGTGFCRFMISLTFVVATGVRLIMRYSPLVKSLAQNFPL